jgi:hypothetical protein
MQLESFLVLAEQLGRSETACCHRLEATGNGRDTRLNEHAEKGTLVLSLNVHERNLC